LLNRQLVSDAVIWKNMQLQYCVALPKKRYLIALISYPLMESNVLLLD